MSVEEAGVLIQTHTHRRAQSHEFAQYANLYCFLEGAGLALLTVGEKTEDIVQTCLSFFLPDLHRVPCTHRHCPECFLSLLAES